VSIQAVVLSWAISVIFVLASLIHVGEQTSEWFGLWSLIYSLFYLSILVTFEKYTRLIFLEGKKTAFLESEKRELLKEVYETRRASMQRNYEVELMNIQVAEEKRLSIIERDTLTALIGNVAHDLKTPLQSFVLDLELLKARITPDYVKLPPGDDDHPLNTLRSLSSSCDFMMMSINRSIDYTKASGNISLVPSMVTFNIISALSIPVTVIRHLQNEINIIINPLPLNLHENLLSDKNWFSENVLCLLSNAVKYSDGGTVNVNIELIEG
jgi:signal transduction histidine kinase